MQINSVPVLKKTEFGQIFSQSAEMGNENSSELQSAKFLNDMGVWKGQRLHLTETKDDFCGTMR